MFTVIISRFLLFIGFIILIDLLAYFSLRSYTKHWESKTLKKYINALPWLLTAIFLVFALIYVFSVSNAAYDYIKSRHYFNIFGVLLIIITLKSFIILFKFIERIFYFFIYIVSKFVLRNKTFNKEKISQKNANIFFVSGTFVALLLSLLLTYGMIWGKYNFKVEKHVISFKNLPKSFDGLRIIQISDTHFGSFSDTSYYNRVVNTINQQNADLVFFTGDMVNNEAREADDYVSMFKSIKAKYGKYAILGNHDMGDYRRWYTESGKISNYFDVVKVYEKMGFKVMLDENTYLKINNDSIAIVGVKSWSLPPFKKFGDLKKAMTGVPDSIFKILLSHNPSHFNEEVEAKTNIDLTLAGHTHGMQMGFYNNYFKWSPIQYVYPHWGGLYKEGEQYINVNKGLGFLGVPIRMGIKPEITLIVLRSS